jgi:hypothetical protein
MVPGHLLFHDTRLSHNDNRMSPSGFSFAWEELIGQSVDLAALEQV